MYTMSHVIEYLKSISRRKKLGLILIIVALAICTLSYRLFTDYNIRYARQRPSHAASSFAGSLRVNNLRQAKELVATEQWERLEKWVAKHKQVRCPISLETQGFTTVNILPDHVRDTRKSYDVYHMAPCPQEAQEWYCFLVLDVILERQDTDWEIIEWGSIHEQRSGASCDDLEDS